MNAATLVCGLAAFFFFVAGEFFLAVCLGVLATVYWDDDDRPGPHRYNPIDSWS